MTRQFTVDRSVQSKLGDELLTKLRSALQPIDCQTCGEGFTGPGELTLAVDALKDTAFAALHHINCRPSDWRDLAGTATWSHSLTWRASTFVWPGLDAATFLVNPSCEGAFLRKKGSFRRRWCISTLDGFTEIGFHRGTASASLPPPQELEIALDTDRVTVGRLSGESTHQGLSVAEQVLQRVRSLDTGRVPVAFVWQTAILDDFYRKARADSLLLVGVTSILDPKEAPLTKEQANLLFAGNEMAYTIAPITRFSRAAQTPGKDDFSEEQKINSFAAVYEMTRRTVDTEIAPEVLFIAEAFLEGVDLIDDFRRLGRQDQILTVVLVVGPYVFQRGPVHLMTPDSTTAQEYERILQQVLVPLKVPVRRIDARAQTTVKSVVLGTHEQFAAASRHAGRSISGAVGRGSLALVLAPGPDFLSQDFMRRYARLIEVERLS